MMQFILYEKSKIEENINSTMLYIYAQLSLSTPAHEPVERCNIDLFYV